MSHEPTTNPGKIIRLALLGNPNTGKTTLFNALTGLKHRVGNYPGVTVDIKKGSFAHQGSEFEILDIPGTYSLAPRCPDELISVELVLGLNHLEPKPDVLLVIADASNLERNLYLATQAFETGISVVLARSISAFRRRRMRTTSLDASLPGSGLSIYATVGYSPVITSRGHCPSTSTGMR